MMKKIVMPLIMVFILCLIPYLGVKYAGLTTLFAVIIPLASLAILLIGFGLRLIDWLRRPVPFRIPTTCGQEKSFDWVKHSQIENPHHWWQVVLRVLGEVLLFRSLFRNKKAELHDAQKLTYGSSKWLWFAGLLFHWSMLIIVLRHTKFFFVTEPAFATFLDHADRFFEITLPAFFATDALILVGLSILFIRRVWDSKLRFISLQTDFFPLFLLLGIVLVGISMRYFAKINVMPVHDQMLAMMDGNFSVMGELDPLFYVHLFLVCILAAYFPFSKLMHMGAIFLSPTRNLANTSRIKRHVNPWNPEMKIRTYAEYEDDYREKMKKAGLPVEKQ